MDQIYLEYLNPLKIFSQSYNNIKNACPYHIAFEFNCEYYSFIFYEEDLDPYSKSKIVKKLSFKLLNLMATY